MPDNLTIQISADTGKARADLELLKAQLRATNKEVRDLANAGAKAGEVLPSAALATASARAQALNNEVKALNKTFVTTGGVVDALATKSMRRLLTQFDNVGKTASNLAMVMGGVTGSFAGGFLAAAVFAGLNKLNDSLDAVAERIRKIRDEAQKTGQKPLAVQAAQEISERAGQKPEALSGFMGGVAEAAAKAQTDGKELTGAVNVMRGSMNQAADAAQNMGSEIKGGVSILRGSSPLILKLDDVYTTLGVSMKNVTGAGDSLLKKQKEVAEAFLRQQKSFTPLQLNEIAKALKFESADQALKLLPGKISDIDKEIAKLNESARGVTPDAIVSQEAADAAKARVQQIFREWGASGATVRNEINTTFNNWLADFIEKTLPEWFANTKKAFADFWPQLQKDFADSMALWKDALPDFQPWIDKTIAAFQGMWDSIKAAAASAQATLSSSFPGDPSIPAMPLAGGGMIRGAGTGTSDSILARLSNGEFVMRAAAVAKWGPQFMAALNGLQNPFGFAHGGLVPRFAAGGLVAAGTGGTPVHLHLGGHSFALSGNDGVVSALVTEAHRQRMRSAGTKPSWYGGH